MNERCAGKGDFSLCKNRILKETGGLLARKKKKNVMVSSTFWTMNKNGYIVQGHFKLRTY